MLAAELTLAGVDVAIIERRATSERVGPGALGMYSRSIEILDQRGVAERFISQGTKHKAVHLQVPLDISDLPTRHNYVLGLKQKHIERILAEWVEELGVPVLSGREVKGFTQDNDGVEVTLVDGEVLRAQYLVGCDGGRSVIRKTAGIEFAGWDATVSWIIAEVETRDEPKWGFTSNAAGTHAIGKGDTFGAGIVITEAQVRSEDHPSLRELSDALISIYGTDFGVHSPTWISRFTDMTRQAAQYRDRRVLLAGDAAHVHPPLGGQGLNIGIQDAMNLGWKLAQVVKGLSPDTLLDTYHAERHPVGARVLRQTMAQVALRRMDERSKALAENMAELLKMDEPRKHVAAEICALSIRYDLGEGHPLLGRRMPDLDLVTASGTVRVFELLHEARPLLIHFGEASRGSKAWLDRVRTVEASYAGSLELPDVGKVPAPTSVLIRPDGHVAWVGGGAVSVDNAMVTWFGAPQVRSTIVSAELRTECLPVQRARPSPH
jgi:3-(3-hydroxy-phenyl)propionate hydroxylase